MSLRKIVEYFDRFTESSKKVRAVEDIHFQTKDDKPKVVALLDEMLALIASIEAHHAAQTLTPLFIDETAIRFKKLHREVGEHVLFAPTHLQDNHPLYSPARTMLFISNWINSEFFYLKIQLRDALKTGTYADFIKTAIAPPVVIDRHRRPHKKETTPSTPSPLPQGEHKAAPYYRSTGSFIPVELPQSFHPKPLPVAKTGPRIDSVITAACSARKEEKKEARFFPTPISSSPDYPFIKPCTKFHDDEKSHPPSDGGTHHTVSILGKKPKTDRPPNLRRDNKRWFKVKQKTAETPEYQNNSQALAVAFGEISRFLIGTSQPKYRIARERDGTSYIVSEEIKGFTSFRDHLSKARAESKTQDTSHRFIEETGRGVFYKYYCLEDDFHANNAAINDKEQFVAFDHDLILGPLSMKEFLSQPRKNKTCRHGAEQTCSVDDKNCRQFANKKINYNITGYEHVGSYYDGPHSTFTLNEESATFCGFANPQDYATLPRVRYFVPTNWFFNDEPIYAAWLAAHPQFLNEKHFSAIQAFVTQDIQIELLDIHLSNTEHRQFAKAALLSRFDSFLSDPLLQNYLANHRADILTTVQYELQQSLNNNKHYCHSDKPSANSQWEQLCSSTLKHFENLLARCNQAPLSSAERAKITLCAVSIHENTETNLYHAHRFYQDNKMTKRAVDVCGQFPLSPAATCPAKMSMFAAHPIAPAKIEPKPLNNRSVCC